METMHEILQAVADGTMDPQRAGELIAELGAPEHDTSLQRSPAARVFVKAGGARLVVVGDPNVAEAVAEGAHRMERQGDTLLITTNLTEGDYSTDPPRSALLNWLTSVMDRAGQTLTVRVNPDLPLRVLVVGGTLDLRGVAAATSVGIEAGSAKLEDGSGPLQVDVVSGSAKVDWTFTGASTVRADMGSATVTVRPDSDVKITAEAALGQAVVKSDEGMLKAFGENASTPVVLVGDGTGSLQATARMGSVTVTVLT
jgi:hypothetical protein